MNDKTQTHFEQCVAVQMEPLMKIHGFSSKKPERKGFASYIEYSGKPFNIEFICGPPSYEVQMFLTTKSKRYGLADLMQEKKIDRWVRENKLVVGQDDRIEANVKWYLKLLEMIFSESITLV